MGIPSYFSYVVRNHGTILQELDNEMIIDNLYLDSNSIIYDAVRMIEAGPKFEKNLIQWVCKKIEEYIVTVKPRQCVIIAFDGVAPVAKLEQQRSRRYKSWVQGRVLDTFSGEGVEPAWNTSAITPGTQFMSQLGKEVRKYFKVKNLKKYNLSRVIISPPDEEGEGEHKIYEFIRNEPLYHANTTTVIYGLDADLIMLTLKHLHIAPTMYLYRETPHYIKSLDSSLKPDVNYIVNIPYFAECLRKDLNANFNLNPKEDRIDDYVFICFMLGNDFLPHFPSLNIRTTGIDSLLEAYKKCTKLKNFYLIRNKSEINWKSFRQFIFKLAELEYDNLLEEYKLRDKRSHKRIYLKEGDNINEIKLLNLPLKERNIELFINPYERGWQWRYYNALFNIRINDTLRKGICTNYLEGLEWTLEYYTKGCKDWRWSYLYHYPPLLEDLVKFMPYLNNIFLESKSKNPVTPLVQLSYVLPRASLDLLPKNVFRQLIEQKKHWYEGDISFLWAYCRYFWESHPILPNINLIELENLIENIIK